MLAALISLSGAFRLPSWVDCMTGFVLGYNLCLFLLMTEHVK